MPSKRKRTRGLIDAGDRDSSGYVLRAQRFPIKTSLQYRESGTVDWKIGTTVNISRSGLLFRAETDLDPKTLVEMQIVFSPEMTGTSEAKVVCWGPIVRKESLLPQPALAANILRYRFVYE
jgi:hypothetical protein